VKLSIIVLTYNRRRLLQHCLNSLLAQTYPRDKLEVLVVDDGSEDGTGEVVGRLMGSHRHVKYVRQEHKGISAARNKGIVHATGDVLALVADDYVFDPTYADTVMAFFQRVPAAQVIRFKVVPSGSGLGSRISHFYFETSVTRRLYESSLAVGTWKDRLKRMWHRIPPLAEVITTRHDLEAAGAAAFRREVFSQAGLFDESLQRAEDTDMTRRLRKLGILIYYCPQQHVKHYYSPFLLDTLYKCFLTGFNRYKYHQKHGGLSAGAVRTLILLKIGFLANVVWRTRQAQSLAESLLYLPFMFLFEAANKFGFLLSWLLAVMPSPPRRVL
jgi:glycosyltransferase involved in cell wall biosynthesis